MRPRCLPPAARPPRRGAILLVVMAMLALFAVLGLSFVLYAESSATAARINREAEDLGSGGAAAIDSLIGTAEFNEAAAKALGQTLFDGSDTDPNAVTSSFRGYGLVRLKYGYDRTLASNQMLSPFAGAGLFDASSEGPALPMAALGTPADVARSTVVNYAYQPGTAAIIDPELTWYRTGPTGPAGTGNTQTYRNIAAAYTYPDMKDLPLAVVSAVRDSAGAFDIGTVLQPSFHRYGPPGTTGLPGWVFNPSQTNPLARLAPPPSVNATSNNGITNQANDDWLNVAGRLKMLRPRPADHRYDSGDGRGLVTDFPYVPANPDGTTYTGDVQNLTSVGQQRNDSVWMYPNGPIVTVNNKRYTALVAPLVLDLGGRVNLATAGNLLKNSVGTRDMNGKPTGARVANTTTDSASSMGIGRWEVNPRWVLEPNAANRGSLTAASQTGLQNLLTGVNTFTLANGSNASPAERSGKFALNPGAALPPADPTTPSTAVPAGFQFATYNGVLSATAATATLTNPPHYAPVDFDAIGSGSAADVYSPVGGVFSPFPTASRLRYYGLDPADSVDTKAFELSGHPAQYVPSYFAPGFGSATNGRTFAATDMRWLATRIAGKAEDYSNADVAKLLAQQLIAAGTDPASTPANKPRYDTAKAPNGPNSLTGSLPTGGTPSGTYNPSPYGPFADAAKDPSVLSRLLVTTIGNSTHRPELSVAAIQPGGTTALTPLGPVDMARPLPDYRFNPTPGTALPAWTPDSVYGPANSPPPATLTGQIAQVQAAQLARQRLARDIFVRLVAVYSAWRVGTNQPNYSTGIAALIDGTQVVYVNDPTAADYGHLRIDPTTVASESPPERFTTLRQLAQLAVNLVDYIDPDDVSTPFVWNLPRAGSPAAPFDPTVFYTSGTGLQIAAGAERQHMVFGTEMPRLVVNEAYASVQNDPADVTAGASMKPTRNLQTRFWVELHNPLGETDTSLPNSGIAQLAYKQGVSVGTTYQSGDITPYQILVTDQTAAPLSTVLADPTNVLGDPGSTPLLQIGRAGPSDYDTGTANASLPTTGDARRAVKPAAGASNRTGATTSTGFVNLDNGYFVVGPVVNTTIDAQGDFPTDVTTPSPQGIANGGPSIRMPFVTGTSPASMATVPTPAAMATPSNGNVTAAVGKKYAVTLRRLANPYLPAQTNPNLAYYNPYVTVDSFDDIQARDQVQFTDDTGPPYNHTPGAGSTKPSRGRSHPFAAVTAGTSADTVGDQNRGSSNPKHSFFMANTNIVPGSQMPWLTHLDRQPLNPLELACVSAVPPSLLTAGTATPTTPPFTGMAVSGFATGTTAPFNFNQHTAERLLLPGLTNGAQKFGVTNVSGTLTSFPQTGPLAGGELHQALDFLAVRGPVAAAAVGAPEAGRLNLNAVNHPNVLKALFDPDTAATFGSNIFEEQDVDATAAGAAVPGFWQKLAGMNPADVANAPTPTANDPAGMTTQVKAARSPSFPNLSQFPASPDQPLWAAASPWPVAATANPLADQMRRTVFRRHDAVAGSTGTMPPLFYNPMASGTATALPPDARSHAVTLTEPLRKAWNNSSTTSDTFLVLMTVAFFEVRHQDPTSGRIYLGKELYKDGPGDLRQKFAAIVDRSTAAVEVTYDAAGTPTRTGKQDGLTSTGTAKTPFFTVLTTDIEPGGYDSAAMNGTLPVPTGTGDTRFVGSFPYNPAMNPLRCEVEARLNSTMAGATAVVGKDDKNNDVTIAAGSELRIGYGDTRLNNGEGERFVVTGVSAPAGNTPGRAVLTLQPAVISGSVTTATVGYHPAGSVVTNLLLGNPGPQPAFVPTELRYQSVVRFFGKINP
jgi:hypothetical protein